LTRQTATEICRCPRGYNLQTIDPKSQTTNLKTKILAADQPPGQVKLDGECLAMAVESISDKEKLDKEGFRRLCESICKL
jgi:hypothetical protein